MVVATDEFQSLGALECKARGMPDLPFVITAHPIGGLKPDQVRAKAGDMVEATLRAVTQPIAAGHAAS